VLSIFGDVRIAHLKEAHKKSCFTDVAAHHYYDCLTALQ
jgi:hypothetical protein